MTRLWLSRLVHLARFRLAVVLIALVTVFVVAPAAVIALSGGDGSRTCSIRAEDGSYQDRLSPSADHWFGTDAQGCDVFSQVVFGARPSLLIGVGSGLVMAVIGTLFGVVAAARGGWVDSLVRRIGDVTLGIPFVVGAILLLSVLAGDQRSPLELVIALSLLGGPSTARIARGAARTVLVQPYIESARAAGAGTSYVIRRHVLPNALPSVVAYASLSAGALIAAESTLTYLGIGLQVPTISWGLMIEQGQRSYGQTPHLIVFPALFLTATVAAFVLLGDALRDSLDAQVEVTA